MEQFFTGIGQPVPSITDVSVDGTVNSKQNPNNDADYEVALDIQVAGAAYYAATGKAAEIRVYWAQDIAPAIAKATEDGCHVCSISWGADEATWGNQDLQTLESTAKAAVTAGMVVFAAAGDNDSSDGGPNAANVDAPASCPHVVGCGGTTKTSTSEVVWNDNPGTTNGEGTGGGYSTVFPAQAWQIGAPKAPAGLGRMVPDVAANADPSTGYEIVVYGEGTVVGGTSAVAPLYAGLFAALGKGSKLGFITPTLWRNQKWFTDITKGSNGVYSAEVGPDACSGIGVMVANNIAADI
jgi:kumamolisin